MNEDKILIGCEEWFSLQALGIPAIKARIDSGAKTSALHAFNIQPYQKGTETWVKFSIHPLQNVRNLVIDCDAPVVDRRSIKSSSGTSEKRYVIRTQIIVNTRSSPKDGVGNESLDIELTLTNRDSMGYRMLLGREAMQGRMIVDPSEHFLLGDTTPQALNEFYGEITQPKRGLKIGLLGSHTNDSSHQRILQAGQERGHEMVFLELRDCYLKLTDDSSTVEFLSNHNLNDFDAIIPYIPSRTASYGCALVNHFENLGVLCLNTAESIRRAYDKVLSLTILQSNEVPIPATAFARAGTPSADIAATLGDFPLVIKFIEGTIDKDRRVVTSPADLEELRQQQPTDNANLLAQPYYGGAEELLFHVLVIDGKCVMAKQAANPLNPDESAVSLNTKATNIEKKLAVKATKALRLRVAQVTFVRTADGPLILSVNPAPVLNMIEKGKKPKTNTAERFIKLLEKILGWKNLGVGE